MSKNKQAVNDALQFPGLPEFETKLTELLNIPEGEQTSPIIIAVFDVDTFMHVNTDFGYEVGDKILIETGKYMQAGMPKDAEIFRIGGDEFAILFRNGMEKEDVFLTMEELRKNYKILLPDGEPLTISIGIAAAFEDANRFQELYRKAESALFRAKVAGRNKVALAREEKMVPKTSHYTADQLKYLTKLSKREGVGEAILLREALDMLLKKYDV